MLYQESKGKAAGADITNDSVKSAVSQHVHSLPHIIKYPMQAEARKDALRRNSDYPKYIQNLVSSGYFKGEIEGSALWVTLEDKAAAAFVETRRNECVAILSNIDEYLMRSRCNSDLGRTTFASEVNAALLQGSSISEFPTQEEDSDDWLNIDASDFDAMLERTVGKSHTTNAEANTAMDVDDEDRVAKEQASKLQDLAKKVQDFVDGQGDLEGALFNEYVYTACLCY